MAIIKCKMCGGDVDISADKTFGVCECCGSNMTFPRIDDDQRAAAFNRGNHFRRIGEFDKALAVYEHIVREDDSDAEAHWCCALCRFGIEYVEDPVSLEWIPTCHRASFDSFLEDVDYLSALKYSEGLTRRQYQKEANKIAEVQRGILATSQNTEPYDVFLCYKESDEQGQRTRDSLLAQDIYYQLTEQGRRVFFARITLEDVAGTQYEPYIFAALNSAKVMVVVGTKPEHLSAVWVKNEWSRFLALMKKDHSRILLPCYRDMDPYDLPEQLSVLQSYDMSRIGFIQDLIRGISKVLDTEKKAEPSYDVSAGQPVGANVTALLKRGNMALEDGEWDAAEHFFEEVLNQNAEYADAYLGKVLVQLRLRNQEQLKESNRAFEKNPNYQKALRFGSPTQAQQLQSLAKQNRSYLLNSATHALQDGDWENAKILFGEVLSNDPECGDAYIGQALIECQCRSLEELVDLHLQQTKQAQGVAISIDSQTLNLKDLQMQIESQQQHINEMASTYYVPGYLSDTRIRNYYEYQLPVLESYVDSRRQQLEKETAFWNTNQYFKTAQKYISQSGKNSIQDARDHILAQMQKRLDDAISTDQDLLKRFLEDYSSFIKQVDRKVIVENKAFLRQREVELEPKYADALRKLEQAQIPAEFRAIKRIFIEICDYKDSMHMINRCKELEERYLANKPMRDKLSSEKFGLRRELDNLTGLFTSKRRKEIEARLAQIELELEALK